MRDHLPQLHEASKLELKGALAEIDYCSMTTDLWTSCTTMGFITITCHFITNTWELKSLVLETIHVNASHTAENIASALLKVANEWNIAEKVSCAITDNANNIVAAVKITGWPHLPCFAHTINLIVTNSISEVPDEACTIKNTKIATSVACCELSSGKIAM